MPWCAVDSGATPPPWQRHRSKSRSVCTLLQSSVKRWAVGTALLSLLSVGVDFCIAARPIVGSRHGGQPHLPQPPRWGSNRVSTLHAHGDDFRFAQQGASANTGVGFFDFPDNGACKRGGSLPGTRDQPGLDQTCCCQVCPTQFLIELQLLELSSQEKLDTFRNFYVWHRARLGLRGPTPTPTPTTVTEQWTTDFAAGDSNTGASGGLPDVPVRSSRAGASPSLMRFEQILAFLEADATATTSTTEEHRQQQQHHTMHQFGGPWKATTMNMVVEGGPCCPLCPSSFSPRRADAVVKPLIFADVGDNDEGKEGSGGQDGQDGQGRSDSNGTGNWLVATVDGGSPPSLRRRHAGVDDGAGGVGYGRDNEADTAPFPLFSSPSPPSSAPLSSPQITTATSNALARKKQTRSVGPNDAAALAWSSSFVETASGGVFNDNPAMSKSRSDRTGDGNPVCCNVCVAQESVPRTYADVMTHPDQMAKSGAWLAICTHTLLWC